MCSRAPPRTRCLPRRCAHGAFLYRSPRITYALLPTRQQASSFNQPLSFDTSSVTTMYLMFYVRSAPCRASDLQSTGLRAACTTVTRHPSAPPRLVPHRMPSFRLTAARVGVQPATELRHVQRHIHGLHVLRAFRSVTSQSAVLSSSPLRAACTHRDRPRHCTLPHQRSEPRPAPYICPPFDSAGCVGVQPAAELRHLQRHNHGLHVLRALLPVPCPQSAAAPSPARWVRRGRPRHLPPPVCTTHHTVCPVLSTLGSTRSRSTSR